MRSPLLLLLLLLLWESLAAAPSNPPGIAANKELQFSMDLVQSWPGPVAMIQFVNRSKRVLEVNLPAGCPFAPSTGSGPVLFLTHPLAVRLKPGAKDVSPVGLITYDRGVPLASAYQFSDDFSLGPAVRVVHQGHALESVGALKTPVPDQGDLVSQYALLSMVRGSKELPPDLESAAVNDLLYGMRKTSIAYQGDPSATEASARALLPLFREDVRKTLEEGATLLTYAGDVPEEYSRLTQQGLQLQDAGRFQDAEACFTRALQLGPRSPNGYHNRGRARAAQGNANGAMLDYTLALRSRPDFYYSYHARGLLLDSLGRNQEALADYNRCLRIKPYYVRALIARGACKQRLGDLPGALQDTEKALQLEPGNESARHNLNLFRR